MNGSNFRVDFAVLQTFAFVKFLQIFKYRRSIACADVITFYVKEFKHTVLASYNAAPHNRYQPHPAEPEQYTIHSSTRFMFS